MTRAGWAMVAAAILTGAACAAGPSTTGERAAAGNGSSTPTPKVTASAPTAPLASAILLDTTRAADDISLLVSSPVRRGGTAAARVTTAPNATCTITVSYASGPSTARGLEPKATDGSGSASWSWTVGTNTTPGRWPVEVTCSLLSGQRTVARELMTVE